MRDEWPDDLEIWRWRQAYRRLQRPESPGCPGDDRLIALVLHESHGAERQRLADHIVSCQRCIFTYQLLLCLQRHISGTLPGAERSGPASPDTNSL
jgi:hypothetical protein